MCQHDSWATVKLPNEYRNAFRKTHRIQQGSQEHNLA